jgi:hypothetical protein
VILDLQNLLIFWFLPPQKYLSSMNKAAIQGYLWGVDSSPPTILFAPVLKDIFKRVDSSVFRIL